MYAVIKTGGKQYRVAKDDLLTVEKLPGDAGANVTFEEVLLLGGTEGVTLGSPRVAGAKVTAEVVEQTRGPKVIVFKKRRRKNYRRKNGHRQDLTVLRVTGIEGAGGAGTSKAKPRKSAAKPAPETESPAPGASAAESKE